MIDRAALLERIVLLQRELMTLAARAGIALPVPTVERAPEVVEPLPWSTAPLAVLIYLVAGVLFAELLRREVGAAPSG